MKEHPIIFDAESVRAILAGRKTQTRRVMKMGPVEEPFGGPGMYTPTVVRNGFEEPGEEVFGIYGLDGDWGERCPYGQPGDLLWVRETWALVNDDGWLVNPSTLCHKADNAKRLIHPVHVENADPFVEPRDGWRSPIHMPRWASRLTLRVTDVRVERVQEISGPDAIAEGAGIELDDNDFEASARAHYSQRWDQINGKRAPWDSDPWVWALTFEAVSHA